MNENQTKEQEDYMDYLIQNEKRKMKNKDSSLGFGFILLLSFLTITTILIVQFAELKIGSINNSLLYILMAILGLAIFVNLLKKMMEVR